MPGPPITLLCPVCGLPATSETRHRNGTITTATLLCPMEHIWIVKWASQAVAS